MHYIYICGYKYGYKGIIILPHMGEMKEGTIPQPQHTHSIPHIHHTVFRYMIKYLQPITGMWCK